MSKRKIIVAITGASGAIYAVKLLERLRRLPDPLKGKPEHFRGQPGPLHGLPENLQRHNVQVNAPGGEPYLQAQSPAGIAVILTGNAEEIMHYETGAGYTPAGKEKLWSNRDFNAPFASGSSSYDTMIICPASMGMLGRIAHGVSDDLITRAADVILLTEAGAIVCPATPSFYSRPQTIDELVMTVIDRVLTLAGFSIDTFRWNEE